MKRLFVIAVCLFISLTCFGQSFFTQSYTVGARPVQMITADFNGDHLPDLATVNNSDNTVSILLNKGDGTFRPALEFATGPAPVGLAAVDWNKDGKMDLVVVNGGADAAHSISILLGNGDGTFQPHRDIAGAPNANSITVGDFNHDGNPDIATSSNNPVNAVYVSLGDGHGGVLGQKVTSGFGAPELPNFQTPYIVTRIARADFNRDGKDDLYYVECCGGFEITFGAWGVLVGNGDGTFTDLVINGQDTIPTELVTVDMNQDGFTDIVLPFEGCHFPCIGVQSAINNGRGNFSGGPEIDVSLNSEGSFVTGASFDIDGDGLKDFVLVGSDFDDPNITNMSLIFAPQSADGSFGAITRVLLNAPDGQASLAVVADFNHDGKPDVAFIDVPIIGPTAVFVALNTTPANPCQLRTTDHTVTLCHPDDGAVVSSPAHIISHATSSTPVQATQIYLDNKLVFQTAGGNLDKFLPLALGTHNLEVKSWSQGKDFRNDFSVTAIGTPPATVPPCTESSNFAVNICSPGQSANVNSPVPVIAAAKSATHITTMQIYVDGRLVFHGPNASAINTELIETDVPMVAGTHRVTVKAWDVSGRNFSSTRNVAVQ